MDNEKVIKIVLKWSGRDENGLQQYVWATAKQADDIMASQFDDKQNQRLFKIGTESFRASDVLRMSEMRLGEAKGLPAFRPYVVEALKAEKAEAAKLENPEGRRRIEALMEKSRFGHSIL